MSNISETSPLDYHSKLQFNYENIFDENSYLSKSVLWQTHGKSLWEWKNCRTDFKKTASMIWGSLIDCLTTCPEEFEEQFAIRPETYLAKKSAKKDAEIIEKPWSGNAGFCKAWAKDNSDKDIISEDILAKAKKHASILLDTNKQSSEIFANSDKQVILHTKTKEGVNLKAMTDLVPDGDFLCDLKMCADFSLSGFSRSIAKYGYHVQAGKYLILWNRNNPNDQRERFKHIWQNPATGEVAVTEMTHSEICAGQNMFRFLYRRLVDAYKSNVFPTLTEGEIPLIARSEWNIVEEELLIDGGLA